MTDRRLNESGGGGETIRKFIVRLFIPVYDDLKESTENRTVIPRGSQTGSLDFGLRKRRKKNRFSTTHRAIDTTAGNERLWYNNELGVALKIFSIVFRLARACACVCVCVWTSPRKLPVPFRTVEKTMANLSLVPVRRYVSRILKQ